MRQLNGFKLVLCPVREPDPKYLHYYKKIYSCWNEIWATAYKEVNHLPTDHLHSDHFTRQDFAAAIFHEEECAAFILFRFVDFSLETIQQDSYFEQWSEIHRNSIAKSGQRFLICGNLGVALNFRHNSLGFSMKDLIVAIVSEVTLHTQVDAAIATPRRDRNMQGTAYKWGATPIAQNVDWGCGVQVDLVAFYKDQLLKNASQELHPVMQQLWKEKLIIRENIFASINDFQHAARYDGPTQLKKEIG